MHANRPILALVLLLFVLAAACGKPPAKVPAMPRTEEMTTGQLLREADTAFAAGRFEQSELFYERLIARSDLPAELRPKALERYTDSALAAGHPRNAAAGLERWAATYPEAAADPAWQGAKYRVDLALGRTEAAAGDFAAWAGRTSQPWPERQASGQALANALTSQGEYGQAFQVLSALHAEAPDAAAKARLEEDFRRGLSDTPDETLAAMDAAIGAEGRTIFPGALVRFEEANRLAADSARWPEAWSAMREVVNAGTLADAAPLAEILAGLEAERGVPRLGLALALPLSGRFADVAWSIVRGAGVAQWQLAAIGALVEVVVVNTDAPDWQRQIEGLAPHVTVVGGPLQTETLKSAAAAGLLARRPTFAFLPSLGELTEGRDAWRFFGSFEDQVRSLVEFSVSELGIRRFAVLNPEERFGARMAEIFLREAQARGAVVTATAAYPPKEPTDWGKSVARLLKVPERQGETERLPTHARLPGRVHARRLVPGPVARPALLLLRGRGPGPARPRTLEPGPDQVRRGRRGPLLPPGPDPRRLVAAGRRLRRRLAAERPGRLRPARPGLLDRAGLRLRALRLQPRPASRPMLRPPRSTPDWPPRRPWTGAWRPSATPPTAGRA